MGSWQEDREYELFVRAWTAYYQAANRIDGHILVPQNNEERRLVRQAGLAGNAAMKEVLDDAKYYGMIHSEKSKKAQQEALRRLENERNDSN